MGRPATKTDWSSVASVLRSVFPLDVDAEELRVYQAWEVWPDVVGATYARGARPTKYRDGKLFVTVFHPGLMQELHFVKEHIRRQLNRRIGGGSEKELIRQIHFVHGALRPEELTPAAGPQRPVPRYSEAEAPPLQDPKLRAAFTSPRNIRRRRLTRRPLEE